MKSVAKMFYNISYGAMKMIISPSQKSFCSFLSLSTKQKKNTENIWTSTMLPTAKNFSHKVCGWKVMWRKAIINNQQVIFHKKYIQSAADVKTKKLSFAVNFKSYPLRVIFETQCIVEWFR